jgi:hypothetical protein
LNGENGGTCAHKKPLALNSSKSREIPLPFDLKSRRDNTTKILGARVNNYEGQFVRIQYSYVNKATAQTGNMHCVFFFLFFFLLLALCPSPCNAPEIGARLTLGVGPLDRIYLFSQ